jgi:hypothetical protein
MNMIVIDGSQREGASLALSLVTGKLTPIITRTNSSSYLCIFDFAPESRKRS